MIWLELVAWVIVFLLSIPLLVLTVECLAAWGRRTTPLSALPSVSPPFVVLIPAHNEEQVIAHTIRAVMAQLGAGQSILVVADNCNDATAHVARELGALVVTRSDELRRGKGYALAFGREQLRLNPPEVVIVLDADCTLGEEALPKLAAAAITQNRPVQMENRLIAPDGSGPERQIAAFAFLLKNVIRPLGLLRLGQPCVLTGTGMAFPWEIFQAAPLDDGHIAEDLGLTINLALAGKTAKFLPGAQVLGEFPVDDRAAGSQRRRWVHGHLRGLLSGVPRLLTTALLRFRIDLAVLALHIGVPPLSALALLETAALIGLAIVAGFGGPWWPLVALAGMAGVTALALLLVWWKFGRTILPFKTVFLIPWYVVKKITLLAGFLFNPQREWVRTERNGTPTPNASVSISNNPQPPTGR